MIRLQALCEDLKHTLEPDVFRDVCPNGLQVEGSPQVRTFAASVSSSLAVIKQAVALGVDLLLVHHGIFWNKDSLPIVGVKKEKIALLLQHNISLVAYHLPLDAHALYGNNYRAAQLLGWQEIEPFFKLDGQFIGVKGRVPKLSAPLFQKQLENFYDHPAHAVLAGPPVIETAALISGGAHRSIDCAIAEGLDCFITGSFDEPTWHQAHEGKIHFFAMGHSATEKIGPFSLGEYLHSRFHLPWQWIEEKNPF